MKESDTKFFRPLWLRIGVTLVVGGWFLFETFYSQDQLWMLITGAAFAYCIWNFFISFPKNTAASDPSPPNEPPKLP